MTRRRKSGYGRKGGTSANDGHKATTYKVVTPDGTQHRKRSYQVHQKDAFCGAYEHEGKWFISGITADKKNWPGQIFVPAHAC